MLETGFNQDFFVSTHCRKNEGEWKRFLFTFHKEATLYYNCDALRLLQ